jgi:hypothetical protein
MKITDEESRIEGALAQVRIDPHDGRCHGAHDIVITALPLPDDLREKTGDMAHVTLFWAGSNGPLSIAGTEEFKAALGWACVIAKALREGQYKGHNQLP